MAEENRAHHENPSAGIYPIQFVQIGDIPEVPVPLARISTCGGMTIEVLHEVVGTDPPQGRYVVVTPQQRRKGSTTGRNLLSALVSMPGHYAAKSWLTERLSRSKSEDDEDDTWGGMVRVDNIVTLLRGLLCPPGIAGEKELRKALVSYVLNRFESGPGYQLAGAPLLWLDVDVIEASVKEACLLEQQGQDAFPVLGYIDESVSAAQEAFGLASSIGSQKTIARVKNLSTLLNQSPYRMENSVAQLGRILATN